jgi:hypothetical protein
LVPSAAPNDIDFGVVSYILAHALDALGPALGSDQVHCFKGLPEGHKMRVGVDQSRVDEGPGQVGGIARRGNRLAGRNKFYNPPVAKGQMQVHHGDGVAVELRYPRIGEYMVVLWGGTASGQSGRKNAAKRGKEAGFTATR